MQLKLNIIELYRLMDKKDIYTIAELSRLSGISQLTLYNAVNRNTASKLTYYRLAKFFNVHMEDLMVIYYDKSDKEDIHEILYGKRGDD